MLVMQPFAELGYLRELAGKYGTFYMAFEFDNFVKSSTREQLEELAMGYLEIARREDSAVISRWIDYCREHRKTVPEDQFRFGMALSQLFMLFEYLADNGIEPFDSREIDLLPEKRKLDWNKLPDSLHYLIPTTDIYGHLHSEQLVEEFLLNADQPSIEQLASLAEEIRSKQHYAVVLAWLKKYPIDKHPEACKIFWLFGLLDLAGLDFESPQ
jgi:hypothetical protein